MISIDVLHCILPYCSQTMTLSRLSGIPGDSESSLVDGQLLSVED
ncbi:hypothetical protein VAB18032_25285 [Micromonospora maris AB-18-032]|nr:hypothetical protein VAB18032_25285 [Micromonospora maris AB-18-032]